MVRAARDPAAGGGRGSAHERRTGRRGRPGAAAAVAARWAGRAQNARTAAAWVGGAARPGLELSRTRRRPGIRLAHLTRSVRSPAAYAAVGDASCPPDCPPTTAGRPRSHAGKPRPALAAPELQPHKALRRRCL